MSAPCQPHATISAKELLLYPNAISGWLRREGKLERITSRVFHSLGIKWRQKLLVVVDSCMYIFKNESSSSPQHAAPLSDYNVVKRAEADILQHVSWCFKLEPLEKAKIHYFSCTCAKEMLEWIYKLKRELLRAHSKSVISINHVSEGDYVQLEEPIVMPVEEPVEKGTLRSDWSDRPGSDTSSVGSGDSDYCPIDPNSMDSPPPARQLPEIPSYENDETRFVTENEKKRYENVNSKKINVKSVTLVTSGGSGVQLGPAASTLPVNSKPPIDAAKPMPTLPNSLPPKIKTLPTPQPARLKEINKGPPVIPKVKPTKSQSPTSKANPEESEYLFDSDNKETAAQVLDTTAIGTFLVRNSRKSRDIKVLTVRTPVGIKEYQIRNQGHQVSLDAQNLFNTLDELVAYYKTHTIPTHPMMLIKGYNFTNLSTM